jgi:hypothetical protein
MVYMQVCSNSDLEDILNSVSSGLRNCLVAVHNLEDYSVGNDVEAMCITCGAICSRIVMVTSVLNESECAVGCPVYLLDAPSIGSLQEWNGTRGHCSFCV